MISAHVVFSIHFNSFKAVNKDYVTMSKASICLKKAITKTHAKTMINQGNKTAGKHYSW
jgi:hypothetical protein